MVDARTLELKREYRSRQTSRRIGDIWEEKIELSSTRTVHPRPRSSPRRLDRERRSYLRSRSGSTTGRSEKSSQGQVLFPLCVVGTARCPEGRRWRSSTTSRRRAGRGSGNASSMAAWTKSFCIEEEKLSRQGDWSRGQPDLCTRAQTIWHEPVISEPSNTLTAWRSIIVMRAMRPAPVLLCLHGVAGQFRPRWLPLVRRARALVPGAGARYPLPRPLPPPQITGAISRDPIPPTPGHGFYAGCLRPTFP